MAISTIIAHCHLESMSPYTQSRKYEEPKLEGESSEAHDKRNWRKHQHVKNGFVHIPARAIHMALADAAKYSKKQIPGQGKATWTAKFMSGIALLEDVNLGIRGDETDFIDLYMNADGRRGSGTRVMRRMPIIPVWEAEFDIHILDPIITEDVFCDTLDQAGLYIGIGQYRPQMGGTSGRFRVLDVRWEEERKPERARRRSTLAAA